MASSFCCSQSGLGPFFDAAEIAPDEIGTGAYGFIVEIEMNLDRALEFAFDGLDGQRLQRADAGRRQIAGDAADAEAVTPVGCDADIEHRIGHAEGLGRRGARDRVAAELDDAFVLVRKADFPFRQQHAVGGNAADLRLLQHRVDARDIAAFRREHAFHAGPGIGRAAHHLEGLGAVVHPAHLEPVGVRMGLGIFHIADRRNP